MEQSFLWYDLETFGTNPFHDRISQFAAVRTTTNFEVLGEPRVLYCKPSQDYLPDPQACLLTGITPGECLEKGLPEYEFASAIFDEMTRPGTTVLGYNSIQFDDEFIRNLFYRNLFDPYVREYANGNSRWDILPLVRACRDLRPGGITWPTDNAGKPIFKLEVLAQANGIGHERAHDALSDVYATIGLARRIHSENPRLFSWTFAQRKKDALRKLFDLQRRPALVYNSPLLTRAEGTSTLICPLGVPGEGARQGRDTIICADLRFDPESILHLSVDEIKKRVFLPRKMEDSEHRRYPVYSIKINRAPFVAPLNTLSEERAKAIGLDIDACLRHRETLLSHRDISAKIRQVFNDPPSSTLPDDPDYQIYSGFLSNNDREQLNLVHDELKRFGALGDGERKKFLSELIPRLQDLQFNERDKILKMINRIAGRSYGEYLSNNAAKGWRDFCQNRLIFPLLDEGRDIHRFEKLLNEAKLQKGLNSGQKIVLKDLVKYFDEIKRYTLEVS